LTASSHRYPSAGLQKKADIPVLAIKSGGLICHYKKIVLPVSGEVPMRQIRLAALLGRAFKSTVYFVSLRKNADSKHQNIIDSRAGNGAKHFHNSCSMFFA
jgi:hypothetical protein